MSPACPLSVPKPPGLWWTTRAAQPAAQLCALGCFPPPDWRAAGQKADPLGRAPSPLERSRTCFPVFAENLGRGAPSRRARPKYHRIFPESAGQLPALLARPFRDSPRPLRFARTPRKALGVVQEQVRRQTQGTGRKVTRYATLGRGWDYGRRAPRDATPSQGWSSATHSV
ncbi:hypothetical protein B0H12DRAFT_144226 [Mycena haematopus]|nr:hypothetical protein B0H12DRAFT_144226 [Mycena haematopus]